MTSKYTYEVIKCNGIPLHFVHCVCDWYDGVTVFSTKEMADKEVDFIKWLFDCKYDYNLSIPKGIVREYKENKHLFSKLVNREVYCGY